jgi:drug/metabolite transporter (DMT)-like permease
VVGDEIQLLHGVREWACAIQLALMPTVLSLFFMTIAIKNIGSTPSAIMGALEPVTAVFIGVVIFGESFTTRLAIGIILILSAVLLIILKSHHHD